MSVILLDPAAEGVPDFLPTAARLKELNGKRIGLLDNIKHNAEYLLAAVGTRLEEMGCEVKAVRKKKKEGITCKIFWHTLEVDTPIPPQ